MKIQKGGLVLISFILSVSSHGGMELLPEGFLVGEVLEWSEDYWRYVRTGHQFSSTLSKSFGVTCSNETKYTKAVTERVVRAIPQMSRQLEILSGIMTERRANLEEQMKLLRLDVIINTRLIQLIDKLDAMDSIYEELTMSIPSRNMMEYDGTSHCSFASRVLFSAPVSVQVDAINKMVTSSRKLLEADYWLDAIAEKWKLHQDSLCNTGHSALDYLHSIYASLIMMEIKTYVMTAFSHNLLHNFKGEAPACSYNQNPDTEMLKAQERLAKHVREYNRIFFKYMERTGREFRACDQGKDYIRDETFFEMEGAIQQVILRDPNYDSEILVNENFRQRSCADFATGSRPSDIYCDEESRFCTTPMAQNCHGYLDGCEPIYGQVNACIAPKNSSRRYEWITNSDVFSVHFAGHCPENRALQFSKHNYQEVCFCRCVDNAVDSQSTHVFNLQWVESDVSENMVITGIRFIVKFRVMQLQIQQGKLGSYFKIEGVHWKPVEDISEAIRAARLNQKFRGKWPQLIEDRDYLILSSNHRVHFDTLNVSHPNVLTGVRFYAAPVDDPKKRGIEISIKGTLFDHTTGKLCEECPSEIVTSKIEHKVAHDLDSTTTLWPAFPTMPLTSPGQYVKFVETSMKYDSGQMTVPLFDALPLVSSPSAPLAGLGIFHKGANRFTGFISLKFLSLDYRMYIKNASVKNK